jgi:hypothetical protein
MGRSGPALTLYFLAPALAELLSGSAPPAEFFNPVGFVIMALLYGGGALIIREGTLGFPRRWRAIFILGAAYAIVEEALTAKSFFDPNWPDLGALATYGRWADTAWIWAWSMILYHTVFSIALPIYIVEFIYKDLRSEKWLSPRGFTAVLIAFLADVLFAYLVIGEAGKPYHPTLAQALGAVVAVAALVLYAYRSCAVPAAHLRREGSAGNPQGPPAPSWFGFIGFFYFPGILLLPNLLHTWKVPAIAALVLYVAASILLGRLIWRWSGAGALWNERHRFALLTGLYAPFLIAAPLQELANPTRPDNTSGMAIVGLWALIFGLYLYRLHRERSRSEESGPAMP